MFRMRVLLVAMTMAALLVPTASAQGNPEFRLTIEGAPSRVEAASVSTQGLSLKFVVKNVVCSSAANFVAAITLSVMPKVPPNGTENGSQPKAEATPASLTYPLAQGAYGTGSPVAGYERSQSFAVGVTRPANLTGATEYVVTVAASMPASSGSDCRDTSSSRPGIAASPVSYTVSFAPEVAPATTQGPQMPVPPGLALLAIAVAALFRLRSRSA